MLSAGPVIYGTTRAPVDRAHLLASTLIELMAGNGDGARLILASPAGDPA